MVLKIIPEIYDQLPSNPVEMLLISFPSQTEIGMFCGVTTQAVNNWKRREGIPPGYVKALSKYTGIPVWMLCPKHFKKGESLVDIESAGENDGLRGEGRGSGG